LLGWLEEERRRSNSDVACGTMVRFMWSVWYVGGLPGHRYRKSVLSSLHYAGLRLSFGLSYAGQDTQSQSLESSAKERPKLVSLLEFSVSLLVDWCQRYSVLVYGCYCAAMVINAIFGRRRDERLMGRVIAHTPFSGSKVPSPKFSTSFFYERAKSKIIGRIYTSY
jgi:hypothetical protein